MTNRKGMLVVIEGIDGSGKTTLAEALFQWFYENNYYVTSIREPSNGKYGQEVRKLFNEDPNRAVTRRELDLFLRDRHENVQTKILPSLAEGTAIILDRYYWSTAVYQSTRGSWSMDLLLDMNNFAPRPDLTIWLDIEPEIAYNRILNAREAEPNKFEGLEWLEQYSDKYATLFAEVDAEQDWGGVIRIDANQPPTEVANNAIYALSGLVKSYDLRKLTKPPRTLNADPLVEHFHCGA